MTQKFPILTKQQQNALLMRPIIEIESDKRKILGDLALPVEDIDTQYLALQIIDYIAERNALGEGTSRTEIIDACVLAVQDMAPTVSSEIAGKVVSKVLDRLTNAPQKRTQFVFPYFDGADKRMKEHAFWLIEYKQLNVNELFTYSITPAAMTLFTSMLTVDLMLQQEAQEAMVARLLEKGRVEESVMLAQHARQISRDLSFFFRQQTLLIQRNPRYCHGWLDEVLPQNAKAREHIAGRLNEEISLINKIKTLMDTSSDDKLKRLAELKDILDECASRHTKLLHSVFRSESVFVEQQLLNLQAPRPTRLHDLESEILPQIMTRPMKDIFQMSSEIGHVFSSVTPPKLLDLLGSSAKFMGRFQDIGT